MLHLSSIHVTDGRFDGTGPLACLSPFSVMPWIRSNYLFRSEASYSNVFMSRIFCLDFPPLECIFTQNKNCVATIVNCIILIIVDIYDLSSPLRNNDVGRMRRSSRNILQWRKIKTKNTNSTQWRLLI